MKVVIVGGGPAGLYLAVLLQLQDAGHEVTVLERNAPDDTFGWGVVFSDQTLEHFEAADAVTYAAIRDQFARWDDIDVHVRGATITSGGHGFAGIARRKLLAILQQRARELGADLRFRVEASDPDALERLGLGDADLIVAADGVNSAWRARYSDAFGPSIVEGRAPFLWLGTTRRFDAFSFLFTENRHGVFQAHCYRFDHDHSTVVVECDETSWRNAGLDRMDATATVRACEELFAPWLDGHPLLFNATHRSERPWARFPIVRNGRWWHDRVVLMGDAAHTAHFSIGSGTKLAMEDSISLARSLREHSDRETALAAYQEERMTDALRLQNAARNSMEWFENVRRYIRLDPPQFAYSLLTRSQRVSHENLRLRDASYVAGVERWFAARAGDGEVPGAVPPMFTPFTLRGMRLENRVVVAPMDVYSAEDGVPNEFHLMHYGSRALGGAGLVMTEMTCVSPEARITLGCTGMYHEDHVREWRRLVAAIHRWSGARVCLQLGHSGWKGSTLPPWEQTDAPIADGEAWEVMGPTAIAWNDRMPAAREMTSADMERVLAEFVRATEMAIECGFDMLELHCAHGYLLSSFITPLSNRRTDEYGGELANRMRFPLEVFSAMRQRWPEDRPMSVRISATDWVEGGVDGEEAVKIARAFSGVGTDIIHVSAGQTWNEARPVYGRMFQTPFADRIRNETGLPTIAVGNITEADQVNSILAAGRADLCALARPHLSDPHWTLHAAAQLGYAQQPWPVQYQRGKEQLERTLQRESEQRDAEKRAAAAREAKHGEAKHRSSRSPRTGSAA